MPDPLVIQTINEYRQALLDRESKQFSDMARQWMDVERTLDGQVSALALEIDRLRSNGETVTQSKLIQMDRYRALLAQAQAEVRKYADAAAKTISGEQVKAGTAGAELARETIAASYKEAGEVQAEFDGLPIEAVEAMAGLAGDGSPLSDLLRTSWPDAVNGLTRELVKAIAQGQNPRVTARKMKDGLADALNRMLTIARTEQLRAYREATRAQYKKSGVVKGYRRISAKQSRTCLACLFADGRVYRLEESFSDHPNGRCALVPIVANLPPLKWRLGKDWFNGLSPDEQRQMMGGKMYDAWKAGKIGLDDIIGSHHDDTWGDSLRVKSHKELGI